MPARERIVEKVDDAGFNAVLGTENRELVPANQLLEKSAAMAQVIGRSKDVGAYGVIPDLIMLTGALRAGDESLDVGADTSDDGLDVFGRDRFLSIYRIKRRLDRAALGVSHDDDQLGLRRGGGELDASHLRRRDDIARDSDDEEISQALVKEDLGGRARIRARKNDREGSPRFDHQPACVLLWQGLASEAFSHEALVTLNQPKKSLSG